MTVEAAPAREKLSIWPALLLAIALLPAAYLGWLISATAVNMLYADDSAFIILFRHLAQHTLTFGDFLAQHNESRSAFPLLIIVAIGSITHWDVRYDMWIQFACTCLVSLNIYLLSRRVTGMSRNQCLSIWIPANLLLFYTGQSQNWTWAIQLVVVMPMLCISTAMLIAYSRLNVTLKFVLAILLATLSTYSYAIGQIAWIILLPPLIAGSRAQTRKFAWRLALWASACAANLWLYYRDYHKPPGSPSMLLALRHPIAAMQYFAAFLGASLAQGYHQVGWSILFGIVLLACLAGTCAYLWRIRRRLGIAQSATVWLVLCAYTLASAAATTAGRLGYGIIYSQDSRYTGFSIYLVIGLLYLAAIIVRNLHRQGTIAFARLLAASGLALILIPYISTQIGGTRQMFADRRVRLAGKAVTQLLNILPPPPGIYMPPKIRSQKDFLDEAGILSPGLIKSADLTHIAGPGQGPSFGYCDGLLPADDSSTTALGWAILPNRHDPGELVLLAAENARGPAVAFAEALVGGDRPDVARFLRDHAYENSGWGVTFKSSDLPPDTKIISAWVYDPQTGLAHRLAEPRPFAPSASDPH